jgi:hypothetical protein
MLKLKIAPPLYVGSPKWFESILKDNQGTFDAYNAGIDHLRHFKNVAIMQPYHAHGSELSKFLLLCESHKLIVKIFGVSNYWPGFTFTIIVYRAEDEKEFQEYWSRVRTTDIITPSRKDLFEGSGGGQ